MELRQIKIFNINVEFRKSSKFYHLSSVSDRERKASDLMGKGFATEGAIEALKINPELYITYFNNIEICTYHNKAIELKGGETRVIAYRKSSMEKKTEVYLFNAEEGLPEFPYKDTALTPAYPHVSEIIEIAWQMEKVNKSLPLSYLFKGHVPSDPFKLYDHFYKLSVLYNLNEYDGLDLGGGTGTAGFVGSQYFNKFTCIEKFKPLYSRSMKAERKLRSREILNNPVYLVHGDYNDENFDISKYSFKPFVYIFERQINKSLLKILNRTTPDTLIFASLIGEIGEEDKFKKILCLDNNGTRNVSLYIRLL